MLSFPDRIWRAIESHSGKHQPHARYETKGALVDHAVQWFLRLVKNESYAEYLGAVLATNPTTVTRTFWMNAELFKKVETIANRDGTRPNRVLYTAIVRHLQLLNALA